MAFYIQRNIGVQQDNLICLWEGDDLPSFSRREPYYFETRAEAERVLWRLQARYPVTIATSVFRSLPIEYSIVDVTPAADWECRNCGSHECPGCTGPVQHLAMFM